MLSTLLINGISGEQLVGIGGAKGVYAAANRKSHKLSNNLGRMTKEISTHFQEFCDDTKASSKFKEFSDGSTLMGEIFTGGRVRLEKIMNKGHAAAIGAGMTIAQGMSLADEPKTLLVKLGAAFGTACLLYTSPSPRDRTRSRMPSSA